MTNIIVVAGWERSGSTILANALGSAPGVISVGEINNIWQRGFAENRLCSCNEPFDRCDAWQPIVRSAFGEGVGAVAGRAETAIAPLGNLWLVRRQLPIWGRREHGKDRHYRQLLSPLFRSIAAHTGAHTIVDASKLPWHAAAVAGLDDFDVTVLHVVRDPRGVAFSHLKRERYDPDNRTAIYMDRHGPMTSSLAWVYRNRLTEWVWGSSGSYVQVRHEDFVAAPARTLSAVLEQAGAGSKLPEFRGPQQVVIQAAHNVSGNPVRFRHGPVTLDVDVAWHAGLPAATRRIVDAVTWPHRRRYGYG